MQYEMFFVFHLFGVFQLLQLYTIDSKMAAHLSSDGWYFSGNGVAGNDYWSRICKPI